VALEGGKEKKGEETTNNRHRPPGPPLSPPRCKGKRGKGRERGPPAFAGLRQAWRGGLVSFPRCTEPTKEKKRETASTGKGSATLLLLRSTEKKKKGGGEEEERERRDNCVSFGKLARP